MIKYYNPLHILCSNGWVWLCYEKDYLSSTTEYSQYKAEFLGASYHSTIVAIISENSEHLCCNGHYGVLWLEAIYECERDGCLSYDDMEDMQCAIEKAEENLLKIGMPFTPDYKFHGYNTANQIRRNKKLRKLYSLEEKEEADWLKEDSE